MLFILPQKIPHEVLGNICTGNVCKPGCGVIINFEVILIFLIQPFFLHDQKVVTKTKRTFKMK